MHRSPEEIKVDMLNNISNTEDKSENSLIHDAIAPASIEFFGMYRNLEDTGNKIDVEYLEGRELDQFVFQRTGAERRLATYATTKIVISGTALTNVEKGLLVSAGDVEFEVMEEVVIGMSGSVEVAVQATVEGSSGNVPVNAISEFATTTPGLADVYNPEPATNGYDEENDESLVQRYYEKLQRPAKSGNIFHYEQWAKEITGVGDVRVVPKFNGPLTMKVVVIDSNKQPAGEELVTEVEGHVSKEMPFGVDELLVVSATPKEINIVVNLVLVEGTEDAQVKEGIFENIKVYLQRIAFKESYVSYAKIGSLILETDSVLDYSNLKVNGAMANVSIEKEEVAIVGVIE